MAALEQNEIDKLQEAIEGIKAKKDLANSAKDKLNIICINVLDVPLIYTLDTLDEIGGLIKKIDDKIKPYDKYYDSFLKLKHSYLKRTNK